MNGAGYGGGGGDGGGGRGRGRGGGAGGRGNFHGGNPNIAAGRGGMFSNSLPPRCVFSCHVVFHSVFFLPPQDFKIEAGVGVDVEVLIVTVMVAVMGEGADEGAVEGVVAVGLPTTVRLVVL